MADPASPGWLPDPERAGLLRWWNGLGWSDARKPVVGGPVVPVAASAARGPASTPAAIRTSTVPPGRPAPPMARTGRGASNSAAGAGLTLAILSLFLGFIGVLPVLALLLSIGGIVRSRALARAGIARTGLIRALAGLLLSAGAAVVWLPALVSFVGSVVHAFNS